jgi:hypothetical protein
MLNSIVKSVFEAENQEEKKKKLQLYQKMKLLQVKLLQVKIQQMMMKDEDDLYDFLMEINWKILSNLVEIDS